MTQISFADLCASVEGCQRCFFPLRYLYILCHTQTVLPKKDQSFRQVPQNNIYLRSSDRRPTGESSDVIIEQQSLWWEEFGMDGWINKTSDFNTRDHCFFPFSNHESPLVFRHHDHNHPPTLTMWLLL